MQELYVLAHTGIEDQNEFLEHAKKHGEMAYPIPFAPRECGLDNTRLVRSVEYHGDEYRDINEIEKREKCNIRPFLSITTMTPSAAIYYYNWTSLDCAYRHNLPLFRHVDHLTYEVQLPSKYRVSTEQILSEINK